jgi:hypothetical protein
MKAVIVFLPIFMALVVGTTISIMIFLGSGESYRRAGRDGGTYFVRALLAFVVWTGISFFVSLFLLGYVSGSDYVMGYEPPVVLRAMKYLGLVAVYSLLGSVLVWWMKKPSLHFT